MKGRKRQKSDAPTIGRPEPTDYHSDPNSYQFSQRLPTMLKLIAMGNVNILDNPAVELLPVTLPVTPDVVISSDALKVSEGSWRPACYSISA